MLENKSTESLDVQGKNLTTGWFISRKTTKKVKLRVQHWLPEQGFMGHLYPFVFKVVQ